MTAHVSSSLDVLHARVHRARLLKGFTWFTRVLLAIGFIPPGLVKALGFPFTNIDPSAPIGYFFDALHQSGFFYNFIGACQVIAAVLLLVPRVATLGALMYFPLICGIFVVTLSLNFGGTRVIAGLMLLGNIYLLCWDYDKLKPILGGRASTG